MPNNSGFAHRHNIENFKRQLAASTDEKQRVVLRKLLAEELAKNKPPSGG